jgi:hypothetical protein
MAGFPVVNAGNYDLQIDAGFNVDAFTLDDPIKGILGGYVSLTTRNNLMTNPNFETNITPWFAIGAALTRITTASYIGTACAQMAVTDAANLSARMTFDPNPAVGPGVTITASCYVYNYAGNNRQHLIQLRCFNAAGAVITGINGTTTTVNVGSGWTRLDVTGTTPALTASVDIVIFCQLNNGSLSNVTYVDAVLIEATASALPYFDGTYAQPYTGYTLISQAWNGTANASTSTATWGQNPYTSSDYVLDGTNEFASVIESTQTISVKRGRRDIGDTFSAGTMSFTILDVSGIFNPFDEESPFYNVNQNVPGLAPMREVKLIRYDNADNPELLFRGYVVNYDYNFALGGLDSVTVFCSDQFYLLSQTYLDELNVSAETSGERLETVLSLPEVDFPTGASRDIATGTVNLGHDAAYTVAAGTNVLSYVSQVNDTAEFGRVFMSREGVFTFQNRIGNTLSAPVADFHDDGTEIPYYGLGISFEADAVINRSVLTGLNGNTATVENATSIATYFIQTSSITNSLLHEQASIDTAASYLLNPDPEPRFTSVETAFMALTTAQRDTVATIEIGNTVTIEKTFPSGTGTTQLAQELSVEGIEHYLDIGSGHRVLISTSPTVVVYELILNDATYGTLDTLNALG